MQKVRQNKEDSIGRNIRKLRLACGMTQEDVVARMQLMGLDLSRSAYSQMECGTYNIKVSELAAFTIIFKSDFNALFEDVAQTITNNAFFEKPLNKT